MAEMNHPRAIECGPEFLLPTPECREVARGKVLIAFAEYLDILKRNRAANDFIARCTNSRRPSVKKQSVAMIRNMEP